MSVCHCCTPAWRSVNVRWAILGTHRCYIHLYLFVCIHIAKGSSHMHRPREFTVICMVIQWMDSQCDFYLKNFFFFLSVCKVPSNIVCCFGIKWGLFVSVWRVRTGAGFSILFLCAVVLTDSVFFRILVHERRVFNHTYIFILFNKFKFKRAISFEKPTLHTHTHTNKHRQFGLRIWEVTDEINCKGIWLVLTFSRRNNMIMSKMSPPTTPVPTISSRLGGTTNSAFTAVWEKSAQRLAQVRLSYITYINTYEIHSV